MRRFVSAYRTGNKDKFEELRSALKDLKEDLTSEHREELAEAAGQQGYEGVQVLSEAVQQMLDKAP